MSNLTIEPTLTQANPGTAVEVQCRSVDTMNVSTVANIQQDLPAELDAFGFAYQVE